MIPAATTPVPNSRPTFNVAAAAFEDVAEAVLEAVLLAEVVVVEVDVAVAV